MAAILAERLMDGTAYELACHKKDRNWLFQEKYNGHRRLIQKSANGEIKDFNRLGDKGQGLPEVLIRALRAHPLYQFVIDVELVENTIYIFDALLLGDDVLVTEPYFTREASYHSQFDGYHRNIGTAASARTLEEKETLISRLEAEHAEGFVSKDGRAMYRPGATINLRFKFWKDLDAVVIGDSLERSSNGSGDLKNAVRLGCYDQRGMLKDICGATKKSDLILRPGDVVKVKYLYGTEELNIVQIDILELRDDKRAVDCTLDQIMINKNWWRPNA